MCQRTFEPIVGEDLREIANLSHAELTRFTSEAGNPPGKFASYRNLLIAICLCQGAAQHWVDLAGTDGFDRKVLVTVEEIRSKGLQVRGTGQVVNGIKDVDVILFFNRYFPVPIPNRRHCRKPVLSNLPLLGKRRIDFMKKSIPRTVQIARDWTPSDIVRAYIRETPHGHLLGAKSVVGLYPESISCRIIWRVQRVAVGSEVV